jgi:hypothetical protein
MIWLALFWAFGNQLSELVIVGVASNLLFSDEMCDEIR